MNKIAALLLLVTAMLAQNAPSTSKSPDLGIPAISRVANGSVVSIVVSDKDGHPVAQGSGFLISKDGRIVTNYHVIKNGSSAVIKLPDGAFFAVDGVLASDRNRDVAIIKAHGNNFRMLTLGDSDRLQVGEEVVAIGSPLSLKSTVSNGIISGIRTVEEEGGKFLQITVPISPGSSGGPLFNMAGKVVGITTSHLKGGENLNFAIPINDVKPMLLSRFSKAHSLPDEAEPTITAEPTTALKETTDWIYQTFDANQVRHDGYELNYSFAEFHGCEVRVLRAQLNDRNFLGKFAGLYRFNLGDIDPTSIQTEQIEQRSNDTPYLYTYVHFGTTNGARRITAYGEYDPQLQKYTKVYPNLHATMPPEGVGFSVTPEYAVRFTKALRHAIELCGGKPSAF